MDENFVQNIIMCNFHVVLLSLSCYVRLCYNWAEYVRYDCKFMLNECVMSVNILDNWAYVNELFMNIVRYDSVAAGYCSCYDEIIDKWFLCGVFM